MDFNEILSSDRRLCEPCYEFHQWALQRKNLHQSTPVVTLHDTAAQLEGIIAQIEGSKNELFSDTEHVG